jgi:hypothetical protein
MERVGREERLGKNVEFSFGAMDRKRHEPAQYKRLGKVGL